MDEEINKTKLKINMCTYRRLNIEHEINEHRRKQTHMSNLQFYRYREQLFCRKINHLRKSLGQVESNTDENINDEQSLMTPNCSTRIQNHFRLLNFSSETEKRLLSPSPCNNKSNKLPDISKRRNSCDTRRGSLHRSCKSAINQSYPNEQKTFQSYLNHEQEKKMKNDQRKTYLLKEMDKLKHTIEDPNSTFSVLAALSRALIFIDSGTE